MLELSKGAGWSWAPIGKGKQFCGRLVGLDEGVTTIACVGGAGRVPCPVWDGFVKDAALQFLLCNFLSTFCIASKGFGEAGSLVAAAWATSLGLAIFVDMPAQTTRFRFAAGACRQR